MENNIENNIEDDYSPYCPECDGCGIDGCCSALCCKQSPDGDYCGTYLKDLKFGYAMHKDLFKFIYENNTDDKYKEILDYYEKIYDVYWEAF